jgi:hypothetical protein
MASSSNIPSKAALALGKTSRELWAQRNSPEKRINDRKSLPPGFVLMTGKEVHEARRVSLRILKPQS